MRRIFKCGDKAVSPVIAVILMVAITVVLAGTVFIWASSFSNETQGAPTYYNVRITITTDEGTPPTQRLRVELVEGTIHWSSFQVKINELSLTTTNEEDNAGDDEIFSVPGSSNPGGGLDLSLGTSYVIKIISIDHQRTVYNDEIICTSSL
jgi:flagellin-like protein